MTSSLKTGTGPTSINFHFAVAEIRRFLVPIFYQIGHVGPALSEYKNALYFIVVTRKCLLYHSSFRVAFGIKNRAWRRLETVQGQREAPDLGVSGRDRENIITRFVIAPLNGPFVD